LKSEDGGGLLVDDGAETSLALDNNVRHTHLAAKGREEDNELDGVNIMSDDNEGRLLGLNEGNRVVKTVLDEERLLFLNYTISPMSEKEDDEPALSWRSSAVAFAVDSRRVFFSCLVSGRYLFRSLKS
jgi:hypothetical protein